MGEGRFGVRIWDIGWSRREGWRVMCEMGFLLFAGGYSFVCEIELFLKKVF